MLIIPSPRKNLIPPFLNTDPQLLLNVVWAVEHSNLGEGTKLRGRLKKNRPFGANRQIRVLLKPLFSLSTGVEIGK